MMTIDFLEVELKLKELKPLIDNLAESNEEAYCDLAVTLDGLLDEMRDLTNARRREVGFTQKEIDAIESEADDLAFLDQAEEEAANHG